MLTKKMRQEKILAIIGEREIETQEELILALEADGYYVTQATISRDIRELGLVKSPTGGGATRYSVPTKKQGKPLKVGGALTDSIVHIDHAGNIIVIKTYPGMASAVATCVDSIDHPEIVGSLAGDDAIFVLVKNEAAAEALSARLHRMLGAL